ncbi:hypothetical protein CLV84_4101 [Neolewinella xylanilytica]|uniref:Uncharacterized protein n=1 Tax=Neolewinella xylanilytica TaxID=1514080 RepID=A0A2S6I0E5_9BACT|nr:hypothetical protein CLV84_4101 [Neolewinella xylanilytica]
MVEEDLSVGRCHNNILWYENKAVGLWHNDENDFLFLV